MSLLQCARVITTTTATTNCARNDSVSCTPLEELLIIVVMEVWGGRGGVWGGENGSLRVVDPVRSISGGQKVMDSSRQSSFLFGLTCSQEACYSGEMGKGDKECSTTTTHTHHIHTCHTHTHTHTRTHTHARTHTHEQWRARSHM